MIQDIIVEYLSSNDISDLSNSEIARKINAKHRLYEPERIDSLRRLISKNRNKNKELEKVCNEIGLPEENISNYWYKGKHFSIHVRGQKEDPIQLFKSYTESVREEISQGYKWQDFKPVQATGENLFVPNIFDLHLGKLSWKEETGEEYNLEIAKERFNLALYDLLQKSSGYNYNQIYFPVGNDIYHTDKSTPFASTTAGTPMQESDAWQKIFTAGHVMITRAIMEMAKDNFVEVPMVYSNHDWERVYYLGEILQAVFANHPNVKINNQPHPRKYKLFGETLIGLAHGHNEKAQELPLIMAQEASELWSKSFYREWLVGHLHHKQSYMTQTAKDYRSVQVSYMTSPSATDSWHNNKAFKGAIKGAEGMIYNSQEGKVGVVIHNIK